jgi:hypothetical protein
LGWLIVLLQLGNPLLLHPDCPCLLQERPSTAADAPVVYCFVVLLQVGKLIYCTRTVPEMEKVLAELQVGHRAVDMQHNSLCVMCCVEITFDMLTVVT